MSKDRALLYAALLGGLLVGCAGGESDGRSVGSAAQSCMTCHNGSQEDDYSGPGMENPHPFGTGPESNMLCTTCHGGNPEGADKESSHVPPPPQIGERQDWITDRHAYFNRLTLAGIDKFPDYTVDGKTYSALDFLQFINPGDLRVVTQGRSCGVCHANQAEVVSKSLLATSAGILAGAMAAAGVDSSVPASDGLHQDTAADVGFRAVVDGDWNSARTGAVGELLEYPVFSVRNSQAPDAIHNNPAYDAANLPSGLASDGQLVPDSPLANLYHEQVAFTCGDCHLGSSGANNRTGDYRSAGCTACHMQYSMSGRSTSNDPNLNRFEPLDPDDIDEPELPHVARHLIRSAAKTLPGGEFVQGIGDHACAGCHQGSNRTVMQYWGIRLDQNQDVRRGFQYPANPASHRTTSGDTRLFDPSIPIYNDDGSIQRFGNNEFNGRNRNQYLLEEDYDGDDRDDTPEDVHYEAGLGCIDCHGSYDLHGGDTSGPNGAIVSRMEQHVAIRCETCHGTVEAYAQTQPGTGHDGQPSDLVVDANGTPLVHVRREGDGHYYLYSRLTGQRHYVVQTRDTVVDSSRVHPFTQEPLYSIKASYAMGRDDDDPLTGLGPHQSGAAGPTNFSHMDNMDCASCHASWTNTCMGCHLKGEYDTGDNFSNITGQRIVFQEDEAQFTYQSPVFFTLGVDPSNKITQTAANTKVFFQWEDRQNNLSDFFTFSNRQGVGASAQFPSLNHNAFMAHSIRGRVTSTQEGPRYCVSCHLTADGLAQYGALYDTFRTAMANNDFQSLHDDVTFGVLRDHFGKNPGNQMNSPLWVHMVAGLGTGLFLFDENGVPVNPLDNSDRRYPSFADAAQTVFVPVADVFDPLTFASRVKFNLDRVVQEDGTPNGSSNHPMLNPGQGPNLRDGAPDPEYAGPLGATLIRKLTDPQIGIVLDSWYDANGDPQGGAPGAE